MTEFTARYLSDYKKSAFNISTIDLIFQLDDTKTLVTNVMSVSRASHDVEPLILQGEELELVSIRVNGLALSAESYVQTDTQLEINVADTEFELAIETQINPEKNTSLEGLFKSGGAFCTQCEAEGFRRITYYLDRPDVMAIFSTKVIADKASYPFLLSNGNKVESGDLADGFHYAKWQDPFPKPCYLFALVAGDFDLLSDTFTTCSGRNVVLEIFVDKGNLSKAHHAMASLKHSMKWDEETFGLEYDLDIYMIVAVDFFNMGAMENKGLNVFNSKFVLADETSATDVDYFNIEAVIAHEYFHNWTGNRVTCRDWFQLSLKEGLTVFRDQQFSADMTSASVTRIQNVRVLRSLQFAEDAGPMAHPIRPEKVMEMNNFYTLTVYEKGAEVIRMLHTLLGKDNFRKGMDLYFERFDGMAVTCDDFVNAMADASGISLEQFKLWYVQTGTPILTVTEDYNSKDKTYTIHITQKNSRLDHATHALHVPVNVELISAQANIVAKSQSHLVELKQLEQSFSFEGFDEKPVLAFLGNFSAPVKVNFEQADHDLENIMVNAQDEFCRWDAGQQLLKNFIKKLLNTPSETLSANVIASFEHILTSSIDPALKAEQLTLPTFDEVADSIEEVDAAALVEAINNIKHQLANGLADTFKALYTELSSDEFSIDGVSIAKRSLKNVCLSYLALIPSETDLINNQFTVSDNMTDTLAALSCSADNNMPEFDTQMKAFETQWSDTVLVMDKWFVLAASLKSDDIFERLQNLLAHPLFSLNNPNRARSLIGAFAAKNPKYFHCLSGKGYQFLSDQIIKLNEINPQIASRLITPLIQFKGFDQTRQKLMRAELDKLSALPNLSKDLKEKLDAALK
ncbi:aminopeptidase N [Pseudocolwellia sp. AS88]|uniref:aminopeptidase N n=1 Tax=Pseudocolwellia sp. AS88 TaxID=3063958 RepID=UPI0026F16D22|nr:aminopeptidase N [Pseudocolwellia sp. AS88]MDO7083432.1 aminopeptidase N [Pseudocolwellia sp. AS88]